MGFGAASLIRSGEGSSAVVNLIILPMAFLSGSFGPTASYPEVLQKIADVLPLTYLIDLLEAAYLHGRGLEHDLGAVAVLAAWGVAGYAVAARRFGWQPRER
jgi:ABC-2 type transport system permease protein